MRLNINDLNKNIKKICFDVKECNDRNPGYFESYINKVTDIYSDIVVVDSEALKNNYILEISYLYVLCFAFSKFITQKYNIEYNYKNIIDQLDYDKLFTWYELTKNDEQNLNELFCAEVIKGLNIEIFCNFYEVALKREEKKVLGQFYTPVSIVRTIIKEIGLNSHNLSKPVTVMDPACGAGIFLVEIIKSLKRRKLVGMALADYVQLFFYGNDINPFAIILTRLNIAFEIISTFDKSEHVKEFLETRLNFNNITIRNTITYIDNRQYTYVIGNPPYFKLTNRKFTRNEIYKDIIFGQPNIYALFIYWAVKHCDKNGKISFIVPQSFRTGLYFKELRRKLYELQIVSLINFKSRRKIFKDVEQAVLILTIKNNNYTNPKVKIAHVEELNLRDMHHFSISSKNIIFDEKYDFFFFIPRQREMYDVLEKIYDCSSNLREINNDILFGNGLFVWNQHKQYLTEKFDTSTAPIIYCSSIDQYCFEYKMIPDSKGEKKLYSFVNEETERFLLNGRRLIVQRTSNFERIERIKACIISNDFLNKNNYYFLENHVNLLYNKNAASKLVDEETMYFYLGLLNSNVINYIFVCKNGNTQVSATELNLLPITEKNKFAISRLTKEYDINRHESSLKELEEVIYDNYDLFDKEIDIIKKFSR